MMKIVGVIPSRYQSSRFPGKPLADICGKPMLWWVYQQAKKTKELDDIIIAIDDDRIVSACREYDMKYIMTSSEHDTPTSRLHEVSTRIAADYYVFIGGDEPLIEPGSIDAVVSMARRSGVPAVNAMTRIKTSPEVIDFTNIKVVTNSEGNLLYTTRSPLPFPKGGLDFDYMKFVGIGAFSKYALDIYVSTPKSQLERIEECDLLRFIDRGITVKMVEVMCRNVSVDTPKDLETVISIVRELQEQKVSEIAKSYVTQSLINETYSIRNMKNNVVVQNSGNVRQITDAITKEKGIKLLDCTLRDGGYVNDWNFGHSVVTGTYKRLDAAGVDFIEVGFLDDRRSFDINRTIQPDTASFDKVFDGVEKHNAIPVAMIDFGTCSIDHISDANETFIDGIRVIFKKEKIDEALPFCKAIKEKGYKLFIQAISITAYSDLDMLLYIQKINKIKPYVFSIVDTYGLLDNRKLTNYFNLMDNNLDPGIIIGYHAHNNFQLAFSNSIKFVALQTKRTLIVDATVYGMGKSAGNCAAELIALHLNQYYGKSFDIDQFLEILDTDLMNVYKEHYWGYRYNFYISAMQNCHPNYVSYLLDKKTLTVSAVNEILSAIPEHKKLLYDGEYINEAYTEYQIRSIDDHTCLDELRSSLSDSTVLLIGPGRSIVDEKNKIDDVLKDRNPSIISINFSPSSIGSDYVFVSNSKRYSKLADFEQGCIEDKLILTSNITPFDIIPKYTVNYQGLLDKADDMSDNALLLCIKLLIKLNVKKVLLAGFDGFSAGQDYYDVSYSFGTDRYKTDINEKISKGIQLFRKFIGIEFVTSSLYDIGMPDIKAVVFDLDGVLLDTSKGVIESAKYAAKMLGYEDLSANDWLTFVGPPIQDSFKKYFGCSDVEAQKAADIFRGYYKEKALFNAEPYEGIFGLCASLQKAGIGMAVATYKREDYAVKLLQHFGFDKYFRPMHGADNDNKLRKSDIVEMCISEMGIGKEHVVMVGDTEHDAIGAEKSGINFIGVTYGFGFKEIIDLKNYGHIGIAGRPMEILGIIRGGMNVMNEKNRGGGIASMKE